MELVRVEVIGVVLPARPASQGAFLRRDEQRRQAGVGELREFAGEAGGDPGHLLDPFAIAHQQSRRRRAYEFERLAVGGEEIAPLHRFRGAQRLQFRRLAGEDQQPASGGVDCAGQLAEQRDLHRVTIARIDEERALGESHAPPGR